MAKPHRVLALKIVDFLLVKNRQIKLRQRKTSSIYIIIMGMEQSAIRVSDHKYNGEIVNRLDLVCRETSMIDVLYLDAINYLKKELCKKQ